MRRLVTAHQQSETESDKACKRTVQWNEVDRAKPAANERQECNISIDPLEEYFRDKFGVKEDQNSELVTKYEQTVGEKYQQLQTQRKPKQYILQLKSVKAVGGDGISPEHCQYGLNTSLPIHLSSILTFCLGYGATLEAFFHGILIPIYKKGEDPETASSYRPVTLSVVMTTIMELYILEVCHTHTPHARQWRQRRACE